MSLLQECRIMCPYCGEGISVLVDASVSDQEYIEDCQVCCRPMVLVAQVSSDGYVTVKARNENET